MACLIGIDVGDVRIGLSVSDNEKKIAFPLDVIKREGGSYGFNKLRKLIDERGLDVEAFVVGVPYSADGGLGEQGKKVFEYISHLREYFQLAIITWDERFTSRIAENALLFDNTRREKRRGLIDKLSAQLILQSYLDHINSSLK